MSRFEHIKSYYEPKLKPELAEFEMLGWESEEAHLKRFETFISNVDLNGKKILDVGCGFGGLLSYLTNRGILVDYTGVDILQCMIESAGSKNPQGTFYCADIFKSNKFEKASFAVVYASGIFNLNLGNNVEFLKQALKVFFELSREIVAFNLLHYKSPCREEQYYYFNPEDVVFMAKKAINENMEINIIEHYLNNDFTVICKRAGFC